MRPGDFARVLLAASGGSARARARDQQADRAGAATRRRVLNRLAALDPEPEEFEAALGRIIAELGEPTRAVCTAVRHEWELILAQPTSWSYLVGEALASSKPGSHRDPEMAP